MASTFDIALVIFAILSSGYIAYLWLDNAETADKADPRGEPELSYLFDHGVLQHASGTTAQFWQGFTNGPTCITTCQVALRCSPTNPLRRPKAS